jgi:hypothetical protein
MLSPCMRRFRCACWRADWRSLRCARKRESFTRAPISRSQPDAPERQTRVTSKFLECVWHSAPKRTEQHAFCRVTGGLSPASFDINDFLDGQLHVCPNRRDQSIALHPLPLPSWNSVAAANDRTLAGHRLDN